MAVKIVSDVNNGESPSEVNDDHGDELERTLAETLVDKWQALASSDAAKTALLGFLFLGWYGANIVFNIYNKQVLKVFPFPVTCTLCQFGVGVLFVAAMWASGAHKPPDEMKVKNLLPIMPLAMVHTLGNLLTNVSLGRVSVSFTHTIKAMEPFFSVVLSSVFLGDVPSLAILSMLVPIVGGVAMASVSEVSFNWAGFLAAMGSNITFQSRNCLSKALMGGKKSMDNINLFSIITIMSFAVTLPLAVAVEGFKLSPAAIAAAGVADPALVIQRAAIAGFCFHAYQQLSYMILQRVSPVTHAVGNCVKRVVVIIAAVVFFRNPVSPMNAVGTAIALMGVAGFSWVKRSEAAATNKNEKSAMVGNGEALGEAESVNAVGFLSAIDTGIEAGDIQVGMKTNPQGAVGVPVVAGDGGSKATN